MKKTRIKEGIYTKNVSRYIITIEEEKEFWKDFFNEDLDFINDLNLTDLEKKALLLSCFKYEPKTILFANKYYGLTAMGMTIPLDDKEESNSFSTRNDSFNRVRNNLIDTYSDKSKNGFKYTMQKNINIINYLNGKSKLTINERMTRFFEKLDYDSNKKLAEKMLKNSIKTGFKMMEALQLPSYIQNNNDKSNNDFIVLSLKSEIHDLIKDINLLGFALNKTEIIKKQISNIIDKYRDYYQEVTEHNGIKLSLGTDLNVSLKKIIVDLYDLYLKLKIEKNKLDEKMPETNIFTSFEETLKENDIVATTKVEIINMAIELDILNKVNFLLEPILSEIKTNDSHSAKLKLFNLYSKVKDLYLKKKKHEETINSYEDINNRVDNYQPIKKHS